MKIINNHRLIMIFKGLNINKLVNKTQTNVKENFFAKKKGKF